MKIYVVFTEERTCNFWHLECLAYAFSLDFKMAKEMAKSKLHSPSAYGVTCCWVEEWDTDDAYSPSIGATNIVYFVSDTQEETKYEQTY